MPGNELVQSVERALDVLDIVAAAAEPLSLAKIAAAAGLKTATAHNLARTLAARGLLEASGRPALYRLGSGLAKLQRLQQGRSPAAVAEPVLHALAREFPEAIVTVAEARAGEIVTAARILPDNPMMLHRPSDMVMPPYSSASALAFQAFWPPDRLGAYRRHYPFDEYGTRAWKSREELADALQRYRREGVAVAPGDGDFRAAAPVRAGGEIVATLGLFLPAGERHTPTAARRRQALARLRHWARSIEEALSKG